METEWGTVFVCTSGSAVHVAFASSHCTDGFLMALWRFMTPSWIQSYRIEQLVAASKQLQAWDFRKVVEFQEEKLRIAPGSYGRTTLQVWRQKDTPMMRLAHCFSKLPRWWTTDPLLGVLVQIWIPWPWPIWRWPALPQQECREGQLTKRFQAISQAKNEFWNRWVLEVFLIKTINPTEKRRNGI
jgi:hypothetical protein